MKSAKKEKKQKKGDFSSLNGGRVLVIDDEETKEKPRIMITSVDLKGPWDSYPEDDWMPCDYVLQKPVSPGDLLRYVNRALREE